MPDRDPFHPMAVQGSRGYVANLWFGPDDGEGEEWVEDQADPEEFDEGSFLSPEADPEDEDGFEDDEESNDSDQGGDWQDNPFDGPANPDY